MKEKSAISPTEVSHQARRNQSLRARVGSKELIGYCIAGVVLVAVSHAWMGAHDQLISTDIEVFDEKGNMLVTTYVQKGSSPFEEGPIETCSSGKMPYVGYPLNASLVLRQMGVPETESNLAYATSHIKPEIGATTEQQPVVGQDIVLVDKMCAVVRRGEIAQIEMPNAQNIIDK
jgi:hypothetical protein